jgi:hypothetical protein
MKMVVSSIPVTEKSLIIVAEGLKESGDATVFLGNVQVYVGGEQVGLLRGLRLDVSSNNATIAEFEFCEIGAIADVVVPEIFSAVSENVKKSCLHYIDLIKSVLPWAVIKADNKFLGLPEEDAPVKLSLEEERTITLGIISTLSHMTKSPAVEFLLRDMDDSLSILNEPAPQKVHCNPDAVETEEPDEHRM